VTATEERATLLRIKDYLLNHPQTDINTVASAVNLNWATARKKLELLVELGDAKEDRIDGHRYFSWVGGCSVKQNNVLFGLPVKDKDRHLMDWVYNQIAVECEKLYHKKPQPTISQKIAVEVIKETGLNIPVGWYLYGRITLLMPIEDKIQDSVPLEYKEKESDVMKSIERWTSVYGNLSPYDAEVEQYKRYSNELYNLKYNVAHTLFYGRLSDRSLRENLFRFAMNVTSPDEELRKLVNAFVDSAIILVEEEKNVNVKEKLISTFNEVWHCIALNGFYKDLLTGGYYASGILDSCLEDKKQQYIDDATQSLLDLNELLPVGSENDPLRRFKGISKGQEPKKPREQLFEEF
jgi:hypothetical protein